MVIEPLAETRVSWNGRLECAGKEYALSGASVSIRKDIPRFAFRTSGEIQHQLCVFEGPASPEDLEDRPR